MSSNSQRHNPFQFADTSALEPGRRERVLADVQAALLETQLTLIDERTVGCDPYNSQGGRTRRDIWAPRRR